MPNDSSPIEDTFDLLKDDTENKELDTNTEEAQKEAEEKLKKNLDESSTRDEESEKETDAVVKTLEQETEEKIEKELEAEVEDEEVIDEEKLELIVPVRRKEILAKYPQLFKDFPYLESAYYRDRQYTEILPTIDDAKLAVEKSEALDKYADVVLQGNTEVVLQTIKQSNPKAFAKAVDEYLPTLARVDERAYYHVVSNVISNAIISMVQEAGRLGEQGEPLKVAATILNQYVYGTSEFTNPTKLSREEPRNEELEALKKRENENARQQFTNTHTDIVTKVQNTLKSTISTHIDPSKEMSEYVRKNASRDAFTDLETLMNQDARFVQIVNRLWKQAYSENYTKSSLDKIRSAYLSKAKTILPRVIIKSRNEALKGQGLSVTSEEKGAKDRDRRGPLPNLGNSTTSGDKGAKSVTNKGIPAGMSNRDYIMSD